MDGWRGTDLLSGEWNPAYWNLLWFLLIPVLYFGARWLYAAMRMDDPFGDNDEPVRLLDSGLDADADADRFTGLGSIVLKDHLDPPPLYKRPADPEHPFALPLRASDVMRRYGGWWCVCGGWAAELHLERLTREHEDVEVAVLRREQHLLREYLLGWQPHYVIPGQLGRIAWQGEELTLPVHELHTRPPQRDLNQLEFLLNESTLDEWVYRRDERIRMPLKDAVLTSAEGIPYLAPQIVLLYKSKPRAGEDKPREIDETDFSTLSPKLGDPQKDWLRAALELTSPGHPWLARLER